MVFFFQQRKVLLPIKGGDGIIERSVEVEEDEESEDDQNAGKYSKLFFSVFLQGYHSTFKTWKNLEYFDF